MDTQISSATLVSLTTVWSTSPIQANKFGQLRLCCLTKDNGGSPEILQMQLR